MRAHHTRTAPAARPAAHPRTPDPRTPDRTPDCTPDRTPDPRTPDPGRRRGRRRRAAGPLALLARPVVKFCLATTLVLAGMVLTWHVVETDHVGTDAGGAAAAPGTATATTGTGTPTTSAGATSGASTSAGASTASGTSTTATATPQPSTSTSAGTGGTAVGDASDPFSATSPFNVTVPASASTDVDSAAMVKALTRSGAGVANLYAYSVPVYTATADTPRRTVTCTETSWGTCPFAGRDVPVPDDARASAGDDGAMVVVDESAGLVYEFWQASRSGSGASATWSTSWGAVVALTGSGWLPAGSTGATASGASRLGGVVRVSEIKAGMIPHALSLQTSLACTDEYRAPATKTDGQSTASDCIPEGARVQLDPDLDLSTLKLTRAERAVAVALQRYGAYVVDRGGAQISVSFQLAADATASSPGAVYKTAGMAHDYAALDGIPWSKLRVLRSWNGR